jgi:1-deoxy-D-xylulose-5-phosphate synthase
VRYPRGSGMGESLPNVDEIIEIGRGLTLVNGKKIALLSFGTMLAEAKIAAKALNATLVDMRFVKPLDSQLIDELINSHELLVTIEDNAIAGGAGSGVNEYILSQGKAIKVLNIGIPDHFVKHGTQAEIHQELGLDSAGIIAKINNFISH